MSTPFGPGAKASPAASSFEGLSVAWVRVLGTGSIQRDFGHHIATNSRGDMLVAARLDPADGADDDTVESPESEDATLDLSAGEIRKLTPAGETVWRIPLRATRLLRAPEVALDAAGAAYVAGPYAPDKRALRGAPCVNLTKLDPDGQVEWTRPLAKVQVVNGRLGSPLVRVAADPAGGACVTWIREGERWPAVRAIRCTGGGNIAWDHAWHVTDGIAEDPRVGLDEGGAAVLWGTFQGNIEFDSGLRAASLPRARYLARVQADGYIRWANTLRAFPDSPHAVAVAEDGSIGQVSVVPSVFTSSPDAAPALALSRIAVSGAPQKGAKGQLGKLSAVSSLGLSPIGTGGFALAGYFSGALDFGGVKLQGVTPASEAVFVAYAPRNGEIVGRAFQGPQLQAGVSVHGGVEGSIVLCGWFCGSMAFGARQIESPGHRAVLFAAKLTPR